MFLTPNFTGLSTADPVVTPKRASRQAQHLQEFAYPKERAERERDAVYSVRGLCEVHAR